MAIPFKRMGRKDPRKIDGVLKYHPQLVTMGQSVDLDGIAYIMKDKSSLSLGDIQSVLTNYVEAMRAALFDGKSVNIRDFGVFSLSAHERRVYGEEYQIYTDQLPPFQQRPPQPDVYPCR